MRTEANWYMRVMVVMMALVLSAVAMSCGGGNDSTGLNASAVKGTQPVQVSQDEIGSLPEWQQRMLADPGWNQPYIAPREGTPVAAPSLEDLYAGTEKKLSEGLQLEPRALGGSEKGASWMPTGAIVKGIQVAEYLNYTRAQTPAYGCNGDSTNQSPAGRALEDIMLQSTELSTLPQNRITYVNEGQAPVNYFNTVAGTARGASSAVYQVYAASETVDLTLSPQALIQKMQLAEMSYRSSLVPNGAPGSNCHLGSVKPITVKKYIWAAYNTNITATPSMAPTPAYNILIAPAAAVSTNQVSSSSTTGTYQPFYFGTMNDCYGGAWIISLSATTSSCQKFKDYVTGKPWAYAMPIYGVLLKRWDDMKTSTQAGAWLTEFGWPVYGPVAYANGAQQLGVRGTYYQWGMWFERGYIWWVDYDNGPGGAYPNVPDEAQAYRWTGKNVYCTDEAGSAMVKLAPTVYYGGSGPLGVTVTVDAYRNDAGAQWKPVEMNTDMTEYNVALPASTGLATVMVKMTATAYGGTTGTASYGNCLYKYYVWAFRDGSIQVPGPMWDPSQRNAVHTYGDLAVNKESVYVVRCQVTDANNAIAYGDSMPIVLGHGGGGAVGGNDVLVIRDDAPTYNTYNANYDALIADLDELGVGYQEVNYSDTVAADFTAGGFKVAIWYRGGPGNGTEPDFTTSWTASEETNFNALLAKNMLLVSQAHGAVQTNAGPWNYFGLDSSPDMDSLLLRSITAAPMTHTTDQNMGLTSNENNWYFGGWLSVWMGSDIGAGQAGGSQLRGGLPGMQGSSAAERVGAALGNGSGVNPTAWNFGTAATVKQFCPRGHNYPTQSSYRNPGWTKGIQPNPDGTGGYTDGCYGAANLSYGNATSGGASWNVAGPGKFWCFGVAYTDLTPTAPAGATSANVLQNVLAWLDGTLVMGGAAVGGASSFAPYTGNPEIVTVTPGVWDANGFNKGTTAITGQHYPDRDFSVVPNVEWVGTDPYRSATPVGASLNNRYIVTTTAGNNGANPNDIDFQFPWYGYITDVSANGVGTAATGSAGGATDDTIAYRGLLLDDTDGNWTRYTPAAGQTPLCVLNYADPDPVCAGYFVSTAGNTGDEIYANYGQGLPNKTFNNASKLEVECVAHWTTPAPGDPNPPAVNWSMFPGHGMRIPGSSTLVINAPEGWEAFRTIYDIDPLTTPSYNGVLRSASAWNRGVFSYTSSLAQGRVVSFDYRKLKNWNGDLNRNGVVDNADKFPVRARIITNQGLYDAVGVWPNHEPVWSPTVADTTFVEGGCYVVDNGIPVYTLQVADNPTALDPGAVGPPSTVTYVGPSGSYDQWTVACGYQVKFGTAPYNVEYRVGTDLDGVGPGAMTWTAWTSAGTVPGPGNYSLNATCIGLTAVSTFNVQIRVTNPGPPAITSTFTGWVNFSLIKPTSVFTEDFETGGATLGTNTWTVVPGYYFEGSTFNNRTTSAFGAAPQSGARCVGTQPYVSYTMRLYQAGPFTCSAATNYNFQYYISGDSEYYWDGLIVGYSLDGSNWNYYGDTFTYGDGWSNSTYCNTRSTWTLFNQAINTGVSTQMYVRIGFTSDGSFEYTGYTIDNMKIS